MPQYTIFDPLFFDTACFIVEKPTMADALESFYGGETPSMTIKDVMHSEKICDWVIEDETGTEHYVYLT